MAFRERAGIIIIIFIEETFSVTCGFRKGPQRLILKTKISTLNLKKKMLKIKRTKNKKFIKHLN